MLSSTKHSTLPLEPRAASPTKPRLATQLKTSGGFLLGASAVRVAIARHNMSLRVVSRDEAVKLRERTDPVDQHTLDAAAAVLEEIKRSGLTAITKYAVKFGDLRSESDSLFIEKPDLERSFLALPREQQELLNRVACRIRTFARAQRESIKEFDLNLNMGSGAFACQKIAPLERAGCYAPGGRFPLPSSVLMTAITAVEAGVEQVIVASPNPSEIVKAAAFVAGAHRLLRIGGIQAIGALAYGCPEMDLLGADVIVGPGNRWVTAAKQLVNGRIAIDMLAGPSELLVIADESADPATVAADLLAQAEHDVVALPILATTSSKLLDQVQNEIRIQIDSLKTKATASESVKNGFAVVFSSIDECIAFANQMAPEHLELLTREPELHEKKCLHYGGLFVGSGAAEVFGDYGIGPNHTLPTSGTARSFGGLSVFNFLRIRTSLRISGEASLNSPQYLQAAKDAVDLAYLEGLEGHANAAALRINSKEVGLQDRSSEKSDVGVQNFIRKDFYGMGKYSPVKPPKVWAEELGIPVEQISKLDANENLYNLPSQVVEAYKNAIDSLHLYPDPYSSELASEISKHHSVPRECIVAGAGSDELIDLLIRVTSDFPICISSPTFGMYKFLADVNSRPVVDVPRIYGSFAVDVEGIIRAIDFGAKLVFIASPNNPSGDLLSNDQVARLCERDALVVIDEAYADFASWSALDLFRSKQFSNLIVSRCILCPDFSDSENIQQMGWFGRASCWLWDHERESCPSSYAHQAAV